MELATLVRKNIQGLTPYSSAREEFSGSAELFLDANENPFGTYNRYPDPYQQALKKEIGNGVAQRVLVATGATGRVKGEWQRGL